MKKFIVVRTELSGKVYYREGAATWTYLRQSAKKFDTQDEAQKQAEKLQPARVEQE